MTTSLAIWPLLLLPKRSLGSTCADLGMLLFICQYDMSVEHVINESGRVELGLPWPGETARLALGVGRKSMQDAKGRVTTPVHMEPHKLVRRVPLQPHQYLTSITKQSDIFVLAHFGIPQFDVQNWSMEIGGLVRSPRRLTFDDIRSLPKREVQTFHQCAGFPRKPGVATRRISNAIWGGADLKSLLDEIGLLPDARYLWSYGMDHGRFDDVSAPCYLKDMPLERLENGDVMLAYEVNGELLDREHGFPVRLMIPGFYGTNCVKWLSRIEVAPTRAGGPFTTTLYNDPVDPDAADPYANTYPVWEIKPESLIVNPTPEATLGKGPIEVWGWAWADGGVESVEVSTDNGATWQKAILDQPVQRSWQKFSLHWRPERIGKAVLTSRAIGNNGLVQPLSNARNAAYTVQVTVTSKS